MKTKYSLVGTLSQTAMVRTNNNLNKAKQLFKPYKGDKRFVLIGEYKTKREAINWFNNCCCSLAFQSGRINKWITPMFMVFTTK